MNQIPSVLLSNGVQMPQLGYGLMNCHDQESMNQAVSAAIDAGCRMFDGAYLYGNEKEFGLALRQKLRESGLTRKDVFLCTKIRTSMHAYDCVRGALEAQLEELQTDYVDLYLIHWPMPGNGLYLEAWRAFEDLCDEGLIRAPGVCNCFEPQLQRILDICRIPPTINQIQTNPYYVNHDAIAFSEAHDIKVMPWSPFRHGTVLDDPVLAGLGSEHGKTVSQVILRWLLQRGFLPVFGSTKPERIRECLDVFDFHLTDGEMAAIDALDRQEPGHGRVPGYDPECMDHLF